MKVGEFSSETGEILEEGQIFRLDLDEAKGDNKRVMLPHPEIIEASEVGHTLLVDDGKVKLSVSGKVSFVHRGICVFLVFFFYLYVHRRNPGSPRSANLRHTLMRYPLIDSH